jgi:hypothetical protein
MGLKNGEKETSVSLLLAIYLAGPGPKVRHLVPQILVRVHQFTLILLGPSYNSFLPPPLLEVNVPLNDFSPNQL